MSKVKIIQTARDTEDRLTEKELTISNNSFEKDTTLTVDKNKVFQKIIGFGGAFTEAASYTLSRMEKNLREEVVNKYFDPVEGLGYSIGRVHINSCDFALENYTYVKDHDVELKTFDVSREYKWVIPFIKAAENMRGKGINLLASPWSPPAWMKTNNEMNHGGKLLPEYADTWARYYAKYIKTMRTEGLNIWAITVQNEPAANMVWDSCLYTPEEERDFVKNHLGPVMEEEGLSDINIYVLDHNRDIMIERAEAVFGDTEASKYVYGIANHWYVSEAFENLSKVHEMYPDKHILFSEGCQEGGVHLGSWLTGERYGRNMIGDFNNWQEGWLDWNLILDETGGPNHVGNLCDAPIIADTKKQILHYNSSYYYIGHFSKFVKPGAVRIAINANEDTPLQQVAFLNEDGTIVVIVMNETDNAEAVSLKCKNELVSHLLPAHSIATFCIQK